MSHKFHQRIRNQNIHKQFEKCRVLEEKEDEITNLKIHCKNIIIRNYKIKGYEEGHLSNKKKSRVENKLSKKNEEGSLLKNLNHKLLEQIISLK